MSVVQGDSAATPATSDTLLFTPAAGFSGVAAITYTAQDSLGLQHTAAVSITIGGSAAPPPLGEPLDRRSTERAMANLPGLW